MNFGKWKKVHHIQQDFRNAKLKLSVSSLSTFYIVSYEHYIIFEYIPPSIYTLVANCILDAWEGSVVSFCIVNQKLPYLLLVVEFLSFFLELGISDYS